MPEAFQVKADDPDDGNIARYWGDFNLSSRNKVTEVLEHVGYPMEGSELKPRTKQQKNPHTSADAFFPSAS
jgi:hypothetical protein